MPEPTTEEPQLQPGGVDAVKEDPADEGLSRDLDPDENPAVDDILPDEIAEADDKRQEPDEGVDHEAGTKREEPEAGQEDEEGNPELPA